MKRIVAIRVRGTVGVRREIADTLRMLSLTRRNHAVIVDDRDTYRGMLKKAKDYLTYGEISEETLQRLLLERGRLPGDKRIDEKYIKSKTDKTLKKFMKSFLTGETDLGQLGIKPVFRLHPPRKGLEEVNKPFGRGGALGYRGTRINELLEKMI
jgi:large subunit ribosomal protein L30